MDHNPPRLQASNVILPCTDMAFQLILELVAEYMYAMVDMTKPKHAQLSVVVSLAHIEPNMAGLAYSKPAIHVRPVSVRTAGIKSRPVVQ